MRVEHIPQAPVPCEHRFVFLRQIEERDGGFRPESKYYDLFFCEKCLVKEKKLAAHTVSYGDGRREVRHDV